MYVQICSCIHLSSIQLCAPMAAILVVGPVFNLDNACEQHFNNNVTLLRKLLRLELCKLRFYDMALPQFRAISLWNSNIRDHAHTGTVAFTAYRLVYGSMSR